MPEATTDRDGAHGTSVRHHNSAHPDVSGRKDTKPPTVRVALYGAAGGAMAMVLAKSLSLVILPGTMAVKTFVLAVIAIGFSILAGISGGAVIGATEKIEKRVRNFFS